MCETTSNANASAIIAVQAHLNENINCIFALARQGTAFYRVIARSVIVDTRGARASTGLRYVRT